DHKKKRHMMFSVYNPTKEPVAVNFNIMKLVSNQNNKEQREETEKLSFYPSQFVLTPQETKKVRVRYMSNTLPDTEEVYRVIAQELNVDVNDRVESEPTNGVKAQVKMRLTYEGLLLVHKADAYDKLKIDSFKELPSNIDKRVIELTISNSGNASDVPSVYRYNFIVTINNKVYKLTEEDVKKAEFRRILAGQSNTFKLPNVKLPSGKIESIKLEKK
ncbi:MAG TPA: hypothetical protein ENK88_05275, partial [Campylobacterales bacterium]|nr:hypothetical protein [Campylobacterales bacterium]